MGNPNVTPAAMRIVKSLVGAPPQTVVELMKATSVTRTAVTEQLNELTAAGLVERTVERLSGRGRPRHRYAITDTAMMLLFVGSEQLVAPAMWQAIDRAGGPALTRKILRAVSKSLADHYQRRIRSKKPALRLREMGKLLQEEGGVIEVVEQNGCLALRKRSCAFMSMADENRSVCCIDEQVLSKVVGQQVRRTTSRLDGDFCCTFEIPRKQRKTRS